MSRAFLVSFIAVGLLAATPAFGADETYTLKLYQSKKGDKSEHTKNEDSKSVITFTAGGNEKKENETGAKKEAYTEEILEKKVGDRLATKLTRTYTAAEKTEKGNTTKAVYTGKTVLIEKKDDKYTFSVDGKALTEEDAPDLFKSFSSKKESEPQTQDFMPDEPIKVGGSWKVPADKSEKVFKTLGEGNLKVDAKKSTITGKLLKVYKKGDVQYGVMELTVTAFVTEVDIGGQFVKATAESKIGFTASVDTCIDGTVEFEDSKITVVIDLTTDIPNLGMLTIKGTSTGTEKVIALKK
jgi:hypothetical protein